MPDDAGPPPVPGRRFDFAAARRGQQADPAAAEALAKQWAQENAEAIASFNAYVREHGTLADDLDAE